AGAAIVCAGQSGNCYLRGHGAAVAEAPSAARFAKNCPTLSPKLEPTAGRRSGARVKVEWTGAPPSWEDESWAFACSRDHRAGRGSWFCICLRREWVAAISDQVGAWLKAAFRLLSLAGLSCPADAGAPLKSPARGRRFLR